MRDTFYKNFLWLGVAAILIFSPIARGAVRLWSITPVLFIEAVLIFVWLWEVSNRSSGSRARVQGTEIDRPVVIFLVLAVISFIFSIYKHDSFYALLRLFGYAGIYYIIANEFDHIMIKRLISLVILIASALSIYGLLQYFGVLSHSWWFPKEFLAATYVNHNHFAGYVEMVIPVAIGMLFNEGLKSSFRESKKREIVLVVSLIIMTAAFILTQSRGAWFSLAISLFIMNIILIRDGVISRKSAKNILILFLLAVVVISFVFFGKEIIYQRATAVINTAQIDSSPETRFKIWQGTINMIAANPIIGTGIGTFSWGFPRYRPEGLNLKANFAHNDYLNMAAEMGIIASLIMIWIFIVVLKKGLGRHSNTRIIGCAIGILSFVLHGFVDFNFHIPANMILFVVWVGIVMNRNLRE